VGGGHAAELVDLTAPLCEGCKFKVVSAEALGRRFVVCMWGMRPEGMRSCPRREE